MQRGSPKEQRLGSAPPSLRVPESHDMLVLRIAREVTDTEQGIGWLGAARGARYIVATSAVDSSLHLHDPAELVEAARSGRTVWAHLEVGLHRADLRPSRAGGGQG
jgi:hypothetical protein